jgi:hypothetical protein
LKLGAFLTGKPMKRQLAAEAASYGRLMSRHEKRPQAWLTTARKALVQ